MLSFIAIFISFALMYLLGAFPTGYLLSRLHGVDITAEGSGNVGATNVSRVLGQRAGLITLACDVCKGALAVILASIVSSAQWYAPLAGLCAVCGHCFSVPLSRNGVRVLKGGKGVATALGVVSVIYPIGAGFALLVFATVFAVSRFVSLSSMAAALAVPVVSFASNQSDAVSWALAGIGCVVIARHRQNIVRLIEGREPVYRTSKK